MYKIYIFRQNICTLYAPIYNYLKQNTFMADWQIQVKWVSLFMPRARVEMKRRIIGLRSICWDISLICSALPVQKSMDLKIPQYYL